MKSRMPITLLARAVKQQLNQQRVNYSNAIPTRTTTTTVANRFDESLDDVNNFLEEMERRKENHWSQVEEEMGRTCRRNL
jgi:hypothetical protein